MRLLFAGFGFVMATLVRSRSWPTPFLVWLPLGPVVSFTYGDQHSRVRGRAAADVPLP